MDVRIVPKTLRGSVTPPGSKSMTHRLLIAAALGGGVSTVENVSFSEDIEATLRCLTALGGRWERAGGSSLRVAGCGARPFGVLPRFDCGESGSTLRFFLPIALAVCGGGIFSGGGRLLERPLGPYLALFDERGIFHEQRGGVLTVRGSLTPGEYRLPGDVSSQFFTGLLFALPLLPGPSRIVSTTEIESRDYILMTADALASAGANPAELLENPGFFAVSPFAYRPFIRTVEADWSQAAFWYAANFLDCGVKLDGLNPNSIQGDRIVSDLYWKLARPGNTVMDVSSCPDLLPPLAVMAAFRAGETRFTGGARLRLKESDRLTSVAAMLSALGGEVQELPDGLAVRGKPRLAGGTVDGASDHRVVMAAAVAAAACDAPVTILGAEAVSKSYPGFFDDYKRLGGEVHVL